MLRNARTSDMPELTTPPIAPDDVTSATSPDDLSRSETRRRLSITKLQRQTDVGVALIALCQTVTDDGSLSDDEIHALSEWIRENDSSDLPAIRHLQSVVNQVIADGVVTHEEKLELYSALETVMPPDIRSTVRAARIEVEKKNRAASAEAERLARAEEIADAKRARDAVRELKARSRPVDDYDFMVSGVLHEGRAGVVDRYAHAGDAAFLIRDRENAFSKSAVEVRLQNGMQIGFVPEDYARGVAPLLDSGKPHVASIKKVLSGSRAPIPVVVASIFEPDAPVDHLVFERDVPPKVAPPPDVASAPLTPPRYRREMTITLSASTDGKAVHLTAASDSGRTTTRSVPLEGRSRPPARRERGAGPLSIPNGAKKSQGMRVFALVAATAIILIVMGFWILSSL